MVDRFLAYLDMGGYAAWVWSSYALASIALIGTLVITLHTLKSRQKKFDDLKSLRRNPPGDET